MSKVPENFEVTVTSEDFANSQFLHIDNCSLAKALKRKFPESYILVGGTSVSIDNVEYAFDNEGNEDEVYKRTGYNGQKDLIIKLSLDIQLR